MPVAAVNATQPALTGRVVDDADLLDPADEAWLASRSAALEQATGHQLLVVTVPSLNGQDIADYGRVLATRMGVGRRGVDDGVLLIVAPNDRSARISVGTGLEAALTDGEASEIMQRAMIPAFAAGDYPRGIKAGFAGIIEEIGPETRP